MVLLSQRQSAMAGSSGFGDSVEQAGGVFGGYIWHQAAAALQLEASPGQRCCQRFRLDEMDGFAKVGAIDAEPLLDNPAGGMNATR